jgi:hypothetical protein
VGGWLGLDLQDADQARSELGCIDDIMTSVLGATLTGLVLKPWCAALPIRFLWANLSREAISREVRAFNGGIDIGAEGHQTSDEIPGLL